MTTASVHAASSLSCVGMLMVGLAASPVAADSTRNRVRYADSSSDREVRVTVVVGQAELFGRPQVGGTVLGFLRRGEVVTLVRRSSDRRWMEVDIGGGELAWIEAKSVQLGELDLPRDRQPPLRERVREPVDGPRRIEGDRDEAERRTTRDEEPPRPRHEERPPRPERPRLPHGPNYFELRIRIGFSTPTERVTTNGSSATLLHGYEYGTTNLAVGIELGYTRAFGRFRLHLDAKYLISTLGSVAYQLNDTRRLSFALLDQNLGAGIAIGGYFGGVHGVDLRLRVGVESWVKQVEGSDAPLAISSDILLGLAVGIELGMPEMASINGRPIGFRLRGGAIVPATRIQQEGLQTAPDNTTYGAYAGLGLHFGLLEPSKRGQLHIELSYDFAFAFTHFSGACPPTSGTARVCRDDTVDDAKDGYTAHIAGIGLYYRY